jgi:hypothetical protein
MPAWRTVVRNIALSFGLIALVLGLYAFAVRPAQLRWGSTPRELVLPLPGDELVTDPNLWATRALTIAARPGDIWPWIVQIGYNRAGFYGYDLIENLGSSTGIHSAAALVPELQRLAPGDRVYMSKLAYLVIAAMAQPRFLVWASDEKPCHGAFTFALFPLDAQHTRLIVRARLRYHWTNPLLLLDLFTEFGDHVAVPRMMLGIRDRAEGRPIAPLTGQAFEIGVWLALMLESAAGIVIMMMRRRWWPGCTAALLAAAALLFVLYARQPLWLGALLQAPILAALFWAVRADRAAAP